MGSTRSKRLGTAWERAVREHLRGRGLSVEKLSLAGAEDEGDLAVQIPGGRGVLRGLRGLRHRTVIVQCKNDKSHDFGAWMRAVELQRRNYAAHRGLDPESVTGLVVCKRRLHGVGGAYAVETLDSWFGI